MKDLDKLKQKVSEMQAEIERLEAKEREPEIPVGTLCRMWDSIDSDGVLRIFSSVNNHREYSYEDRLGTTWKNARIANDIPGVMVWEKHDGGPCPVGGRVLVVAVDRAETTLVEEAGDLHWKNVTAYAIINEAEWM